MGYITVNFVLKDEVYYSKRCFEGEVLYTSVILYCKYCPMDDVYYCKYCPKNEVYFCKYCPKDEVYFCKYCLKDEVYFCKYCHKKTRDQ